MKIRRYLPADEAPVLALWRDASRVGHPFLSEAELDHQQALIAAQYLPNSETWVAEAEGRILGFIGLLDRFIGGLFVAPEAHGTGIGRTLIEHAYRLKGPLTVEVYADNPIAPGFYRRCGFSEIGRKDHDDEGRPLPLLVLEKA